MSKLINELSFKLFKSVLKGKVSDPYFDKIHGVYFDSEASYAKDHVLDMLEEARLSGEQLNKSFYASFQDVLDRNVSEIWADQMMHYFSTYGQLELTGSIDSSLVFVPADYLSKKIPELKGTADVPVVVINSLSKSELVERCLGMLSGIALKQDTLESVFSLLEKLDFDFSSPESSAVKNKEYKVLLADKKDIYPTEPIDALRFMVYKATGSFLLIKSQDVIDALEEGSPSVYINVIYSIKFEKWAEIFNRFKVLFLAIKKSDKELAPAINKIAKLSKTYHKPMKKDVLNDVTSREFTDSMLRIAMKKASIFQITRAYRALYTRVNGQSKFSRRIRNGKVYYDKNYKNETKDFWARHLETIEAYLVQKLSEKVQGKNILVDKGIKLAIPATEKSFVGNIPLGTKFTGRKLNIGIYWENGWGAGDLDLSATKVGAKVGWNGSFRNSSQLIYSGDMTYAPEGAVEYMRVKDIKDPWLFHVNVYTGNPDSKFKIVIGKGDSVSNQYMMDPNKVSFECMSQAPSRESTFGIVMPERGKTSFVLCQLATGKRAVSKGNGYLLNSIYEEWSNAPYLNKLLKKAGANVIKEVEDGVCVDIDLRVKSLTKDSIIGLFR